MSLDTVTIQCFLAVAETQSFTKAAERVGRTQSAISQQIAKLENLVEKQLINRGRELSLTPDGELFLGYAKRIYELHRESLDHFKAPELHGELRFGLPEDFAAIFLSDILVEFSRLHPRVMLNVECDLTLNLINRFKKGELDLILIKTHHLNQIEDGFEVWDEPVEWVGKKDLLPKLTEDTVIPLVLSPAPCVYRENVLDTLEVNNKRWRLVFSSPSYAGKMAAVQAGLGITAIARSMIPANLDRLDNTYFPALKNIHVTIFKRNSKNPAIKSLEYFIIDKLKQ